MKKRTLVKCKKESRKKTTKNALKTKREIWKLRKKRIRSSCLRYDDGNENREMGEEDKRKSLMKTNKFLEYKRLFLFSKRNVSKIEIKERIENIFCENNTVTTHAGLSKIGSSNLEKKLD